MAAAVFRLPAKTDLISLSNWGLLMHRFIALAASAVLGIAPVASAADLPVKSPVTPVAALHNWTGFYFGLNAGYGWGGSAGNSVTVVSDPVVYLPDTLAFIIQICRRMAPLVVAKSVTTIKPEIGCGALLRIFNFQI